MDRPIPHPSTHGPRGDEFDEDLFGYLLEEPRIAVAGLRTPCPPLTPYTEAALRARLDAHPDDVTSGGAAEIAATEQDRAYPDRRDVD